MAKTDKEIVDLYFIRSEKAIEESENKYGSYIKTVAYNILYSLMDAEEVLSDTLLRTWNSIPPKKPNSLKMFLCKIARNLSFDRYKAKNTAKRGSGETAAVLEELSECVASGDTTENLVDLKELKLLINKFIYSLNGRDARIFVRRYFYCESVKAISERYELTENNVSVILSRLRNKLHEKLRKEGYL
ncbi:MAG: sigma-70 family RNA polymerase sigma factor [Clostridia bacterium]|nr:sigma-70 family RNA polymerase sigma factor [Clostridia bacterium]